MSTKRACIVEAPRVKTLRWLREQITMAPDYYPQHDALLRRLDAMIATVPTDDDACVPLHGSSRIVFDGAKHTLVKLLYELCTPQLADSAREQLRQTCACTLPCLNPRHWLPLALFTRREMQTQRNQYGTTRVTEDLLSTIYPHLVARRPVYRRGARLIRLAPNVLLRVVPQRRRRMQLERVNTGH